MPAMQTNGFTAFPITYCHPVLVTVTVVVLPLDTVTVFSQNCKPYMPPLLLVTFTRQVPTGIPVLVEELPLAIVPKLVTIEPFWLICPEDRS